MNLADLILRYGHLRSRVECMIAAKNEGDEDWELQLKHIGDLIERWNEEDGATQDG